MTNEELERRAREVRKGIIIGTHAAKSGHPGGSLSSADIMWFATRRREATAIMVPSNFTYSLREASHHFRRNWTTVLGAVVTIFLSLFIIGLFVLGSAILENMVEVAGVDVPRGRIDFRLHETA